MSEITIQAVTRVTYVVNGKTFLSLYGACYHKAKRDLIKEFATFKGEEVVWHYSLMLADDLEECESQEGADSSREGFNIEKWTQMKRQRASQYHREYKAQQKEILPTKRGDK